jgi:hypothetical protein
MASRAWTSRTRARTSGTKWGRTDVCVKHIHVLQVQTAMGMRAQANVNVQPTDINQTVHAFEDAFAELLVCVHNRCAGGLCIDGQPDDTGVCDRRAVMNSN